MALSKKSLQRKREKKRKNRKIKIVNQASSMSTNYNSWAIHECFVPIGLWEMGIGQVIVSRKNNQNKMVVGVYLIDVFCLGIKNCFVRPIDSDQYEFLLEQIIEACGEMKPVEPSYANTLICKAVEYANKIGFKPHRDFPKAKNLLKNILFDENLELIFGKDGKPCYMQGPNESPYDIKRIMHTLETNMGEGNYNFLISVPQMGGFIK